MSGVVVAFGHEWRGDDAVGAAVAARALVEGVAVAFDPGTGDVLLDAWSEADRVYVVDAMHSGAVPGTVRWVKVAEVESMHALSTHGLGAGDTVRLGLALGLREERLRIVAIEAGSFGVGRGLTPAVAAAVAVVAARIVEEERRCV